MSNPDTNTRLNTSTLRPGLLVSVKTSVTGNVKYDKRDLDPEHQTEDGKTLTRWETKRTIADRAEYDAAGRARSKARAAISAVCTNSSFGLLCPQRDADLLDKAIAEARSIADEFNATARLSRLRMYIMTGRVAPDDLEAIRAINSEVRDLLDAMEDGIQNLDVKAVREAATKAKNLGAMLSPDAAARIQIAVEAVRSTARKMTAAGETAAQEIDRRTLDRIAEARTAFLDLDNAREVAAPEAEGRAVDFEPEPTPVEPVKTAVNFEME